MSDHRFDQPLIAVDVVPLRFTGTQLQVGVIRREFDPFAGRLALPGVLLGVRESLMEAAIRALSTKARFERAAVRHVAQVETFDGPLRDPRQAAISVSYLAAIDPSFPGVGTALSDLETGVSETETGRVAASGDEPRTRWEAVDERTSLPFDHDSIVAAALDSCRIRLWGDLPLTRAILGESFATSAAAALVTTLSGEAPDHGNLNRLLKRNNNLTPTTTQASGRGRPATVWSWK